MLEFLKNNLNFSMENMLVPLLLVLFACTVIHYIVIRRRAPFWALLGVLAYGGITFLFSIGVHPQAFFLFLPYLWPIAIPLYIGLFIWFDKKAEANKKEVDTTNTNDNSPSTTPAK